MSEFSAPENRIRKPLRRGARSNAWPWLLLDRKAALSNRAILLAKVRRRAFLSDDVETYLSVKEILRASRPPGAPGKADKYLPDIAQD